MLTRHAVVTWLFVVLLTATYIGAEALNVHKVRAANKHLQRVHSLQQQHACNFKLTACDQAS
jgi:hypothetical protein